MKSIAIISTGGTIEKTYDELDGILKNGLSVLDTMLASLVFDGVNLHRVSLMNKDSREMEYADHDRIADEAAGSAAAHDGVVIVHGTDRLEHTGERIVSRHPNLQSPCVLTGAMRPWIMRNTDALQNLVEAILAAQLLSPGVYVSMHSQVLAFPGVTKDAANKRFQRREASLMEGTS